MTQITPSALRRAVESRHGCRAGLAQTVTLRKTFGEKVWEGAVHVFDLAGHPNASQAYAWSSPIAGSNRPRLFSVLQLPPIMSPDDAVAAVMATENETA